MPKVRDIDEPDEEFTRNFQTMRIPKDLENHSEKNFSPSNKMSDINKAYEKFREENLGMFQKAEESTRKELLFENPNFGIITDIKAESKDHLWKQAPIVGNRSMGETYLTSNTADLYNIKPDYSYLLN